MEDIKKEASLELHFIIKDKIFTHFILFDNIYSKVSNYISIIIDISKFKYGYDILPTKIEVFDDKNKKYSLVHIFNIHFGRNVGYCL